ncbi:MAG: hypothetical protein PWR31_348 [Bacillota bacterium]|jgi:hypothetical protein|nr:hypothetical protein [Bacillota bacterium]
MGTNLKSYIYLRVPPDVAARVGASKMAVPIGRHKNFHDVLAELAVHSDPFFREFIAGRGSTEEGPFMLVLNGKSVSYEELVQAPAYPGDEVIFVAPILGG